MEVQPTGWLYSLQESEFGEAVKHVLMPSRPIQQAELLKGRAERLKGIKQAFYSPGKQVFIYGYRGVGKTSLGQTAAFQCQSSDKKPILLACSKDSSFFSIIYDMVEQALPSDPRTVRRLSQANLAASIPILSAGITKSIEQGRIPSPKSINECLRLAELVAGVHSRTPVVVIDEFDLLIDENEQAKFADFIKQIADQGINLRFIFCGIADIIDELFKAHASVYRYFHTVKLDRLDYEARFEIIDSAANHLGIAIDETTKIRIARISDGFPHYVHLICEKLFWLVYENKACDGIVTADLFENAMELASDAMEPQLKRPYIKATQKYVNEYEPILWAVADNHELQRPTSGILESYYRIMRDLNKQPIEKSKFYTRMNALKQDACGNILIGTRQGWYEFKEKIVRGYARLKAEQAGVRLEIEHPLQKKRIRDTQ